MVKHIKTKLDLLKHEIELLRQQLHFARTERQVDLETGTLICLAECHAQFFNLTNSLLETAIDRQVHAVFGPACNGVLMDAEQFTAYLYRLSDAERSEVYSLRIEFIFEHGKNTLDAA